MTISTRIERLTSLPAVLGMVSWILFAGCSSGDSPTPSPSTRSASPTTGATGRSASNGSAEDTWFADFIGDSQVGWTHVHHGQAANGEIVIQAESELSVQRFGTQVTQKISSTSRETVDGKLVSFEASSESGGEIQRSQGIVEGDVLRIETSGGGTSETKSIPWKAEFGGFFALDESLRRAPMKPGETRKITALLPVLNQMAEYSLRAVDRESTTVLDASQDLLRISVTTQIGQHRLETLIWTDHEGDSIKTKVPAMQQVSYRTTRERALARGQGKGFDLGTATLVPLENGSKQLLDAKRVLFVVRSTNEADLRRVFSEGESQRIHTQIAESPVSELEIEVRAIRPDSTREPGISIAEPSAGCRAANSRIQSDAPAVAKLSQTWAPDSNQDEWSVACLFEKAIRQNMTPREFAPAMASAATVAETLSGDCTEHAVLLTALLRHRKIPARVACGLVYSPNDHGLAFHMWTEAWIQQRWVALDATRGRGGIGAGYLKLADSDLQSGNDADLFLPVFQVMGGIQVTVKEIE